MAATCKVHFDGAELTGFDWVAARLLPAPLVRRLVAKRIAEHFQMTNVKPGELSFTLPEQPELVFEIIGQDGSFNARPYLPETPQDTIES